MTILERARQGLLPQVSMLDFHAHLGRTKFFYIPGDPSIDGMVAKMDRLGVERIAISAHLAISGDYVLGNREVYAAMQRYPTRVAGYATANPNYGRDCLRELEYCFDELGFRMIKLHPDFMSAPVNSAACAEVIRFAADRKAIVLSHTDARVNANHPVMYSHPAWFEPFLDRYPEVDFILAHCGLTNEAFYEALRLAKTYANAYLDTTGFRFSSAWTVELIAGEAGAEKLVFGSDIPFNDAGSALGRVLFAPVPDSDKELILAGNARRLLGKRGL